MVPYWLLFFIFAFGAVLAMRRAQMVAGGGSAQTYPTPLRAPANGTQVAADLAAFRAGSARHNIKALFFASLVPIILIGFRYYVGTDYPNYLGIFQRISHLSFSSALNKIDMGYAALNWGVSHPLGGGFWLVNLVCAILFTYGMIQFARTQPNPWLAVTVAVPYLVITVGMGLSRQAVAIGLGMAGLAAISKGSFPKFVAFVLAGTLFHRTVFVLIPIVALAYSRNRLVAIGVGLLGSLAGYYVLTSGGAFDRLQATYITHTIGQSQGAMARLSMNLPAAVLFILYAKRFSADASERLAYLMLSAIAFICIGLLLVFPSLSTPIDRMSLYIIPLQLFVLSRLPSVFHDRRGHPSGPLTLCIILYCALVEYVWLNYAVFARDWIPYQFYPLQWFG